MRYRERRSAPSCEMDMTPMIDMSFQLICFFLFALNLGEADYNERIRLPSSELAKPADRPAVSPIMLQLTEQGTVLLAGDEVTLPGLWPLLVREKQLLADPRTATVIIRADRDAKTGRVQELIRMCQQTGFEKFTLRAKQEIEAGKP